MIILGTNDGVWSLQNGTARPVALAGKMVSHVAMRDGVMVAAVPHDGLYLLDESGARQLWSGDTRACAVGPDGRLYAGTEPAMVYRSDDGGATWKRLDQIDQLPTRRSWYFPAPPHRPHVRSIDFLPGKPASVLVGVEVGGVLLSDDRGESWRELNNGTDTDIHTVRPDPSHASRFVAVTGAGIFVTEDGGEFWEQRMAGLAQEYAVGLAINPNRAGDLLAATGERPPGFDGRLYHSLDAGRQWVEVVSSELPDGYNRVPVPFFADGAAWIATDDGHVYRATDPRGTWEQVCALPIAINAVAVEGHPSSVTAGR